MSSKQAQTRVNSSRGGLRHPLSLAAATLRDLPTALAVSWTMALREIVSTYRKSKLGFLWIVIQPALYAGIFVIIKFGMKGAGFDVDVGAVPPALFALVGMTLYQAWFEALSEQLEFIRRSASLLKTVRFPPETFFFTPMIIALIHLAIRLVVIGIAVLATGWRPGVEALWFPLAAIGVVFVGQALGLLLMPLASLYQDVRRFVSSISAGLMLLSPVLYPATIKTDTLLHAINTWNPLAATLATTRDLLLGGSHVLLGPAIAWFVAASIVTLFMMVFIRAVLPILIERL